MIIESKPGIYLIFCLANQRVYIGQSQSVKSRLADHQKHLKQGKHINSYLQKAYDKYGVDMFVFRSVEYPEDTSVESLTTREQYWIDQFDAMNPRRGFNLREAQKSTTNSRVLVGWSRHGWGWCRRSTIRGATRSPRGPNRSAGASRSKSHRPNLTRLSSSGSRRSRSPFLRIRRS